VPKGALAIPQAGMQKNREIEKLDTESLSENTFNNAYTHVHTYIPELAHEHACCKYPQGVTTDWSQDSNCSPPFAMYIQFSR
jgi:hypothetical protein